MPAPPVNRAERRDRLAMTAPQNRSAPLPQLPRPDEPLAVALIGAGNRSRTIYEPLFPSVQPWLTVTAICDPVREHGAAMAERLGARYYADIHELARDRPMEAALGEGERLS